MEQLVSVIVAFEVIVQPNCHYDNAFLYLSWIWRFDNFTEVQCSMFHVKLLIIYRHIFDLGCTTEELYSTRYLVIMLLLAISPLR